MEAQEDESEEAANSSAEIGPAPISQFLVEEIEPVKTSSPSHPSPGRVSATLDMSASRKLFGANPKSPKSSRPESVLSEAASPVKIDRRPPASTGEMKPLQVDDGPGLLPAEILDSSQPSQITKPPSQPIAGKCKRKLSARDEEPSAPLRTSKVLSDKTPALNIGKNGKKPMKLSTSAKSRGHASSNGTSERKVLGAKSVNQDVTSPNKKTVTVSSLDEVSAAKVDAFRDTLRKESKAKEKSSKAKKDAVPIPVLTGPPSPLAPIVTSIESEIIESLEETPRSSQSGHPQAESPASSLHAGGRDTPPPGDINNRGEASRPSRRARAQISYTEPNLRDKMRRPRKQLFDAVTGEGKFIHRNSIVTEDLNPSAPSSAKSDASLSKFEGDARNKMREMEFDKSPLPKVPAEPSQNPEGEAVSGFVQRNKTRSPTSVASNNLEATSPEPCNLHHPKEEESPPPAAGPVVQATDPYDFTSSSPPSLTVEQSSILSTRSSTLDEDSIEGSAPLHGRSKPRRASSMRIDYSEALDDDDYKPHNSHGRKRASMAFPKRNRNGMEGEVDSRNGTCHSAGHGSGRGGSIRRKSMMI